MNPQRSNPSNGTGPAKNGQGIHKKKRKRKFFQINDNAMNSPTKHTSATMENHDVNQSLHPRKKRRNKKKNTPEGGSATQIIKPVLIVKKPEDYSANWKMLKEIITQDDQKTVKDKSKFRYRKPKGKMQKINGTESSNNKVENQETPKQEKEKLDIWFDNVDPILLEEHAPSQDTEKPGIKRSDKKSGSKTLVKEDSFEGVTKFVAMDCEMVGVGMNGKDSILARVSIVNQHGKVLYDKFVKPTEEVVDYRTAVSGIRPQDLVNGYDFSVVQKEVSDLIEGHILVGHAIHNDLRTLYLSHPRSNIRDTSKYKGFKRLFGGRTPSLKKLVEQLLGIQIQEGEHNSVQDAQAAMRLYTMHRREWEKSCPNKYKKRHLIRKDMASAKNKEQSSEAPSGN
ncbi:hypothetical protein O3P69_008853 [Scylla paramamosain]|uniref:RNA exonuclease 4 n=1 Tax=Scylla paramamosain TaxID=85552 RepID=A0AAW0TQS0_SCYPA